MLFWTRIKTVAAVAAVLALSGIVGPVPVAQAAGTGGLSGTITQVGANSISIQPNKGQPIAVNYNSATVVKVNGQVAKASDLKVGMTAMVIGQHISMGTPITEIRAYMPTSTGSQPTTTRKHSP
ncbi:MAG: hypothetical protein NTV49_02650 [Kiritimatiellaeota bacterium]|nr:hypothetical protein [Kiritimatiellota bacterium]